MRPGRQARPVVGGERVLASAPVTGSDDVVAGTREALYVVGRRLPWEQVHAAAWDSDAGVLTVSEMGEYGVPRPVHTLPLDRPDRLLQLVRERVTASVVLQRTVPLPRGSVRIVARRAGGGDRSVTWFVDYDDADPADPEVAALVEAALGAAQDDLGGA